MLQAGIAGSAMSPRLAQLGMVSPCTFSYTWVIMPMPIWHWLSIAVWPVPWLSAALHKFLAIALARI